MKLFRTSYRFSLVSIFSTFTISLAAQDFTPDLGDQLNKQGILQRETEPFPLFPTNMARLQGWGIQAPQQEISNPWLEWATLNFSLQYGFGYTHSFLNRSTTKKNSGTVNWLVSAPYDFIVLPSLNVSGSRVESAAGSDTAETLSISPAIQVGHPIFPSITTNVWNGKLTLYGKVGYTAADTSSLLGATPAFSQMAGWSFGANAQYSVDATKNAKISITPSFSYNENETVNVPAGTTTATYQENIAVKLGVNYTLSAISTNLVLSPFGTWLRNINFSTAPGQKITDDDWAQFGADLMFSWKNRKGHLISADAGYAYDAFNSSKFIHTATLQIKYSF